MIHAGDPHAIRVRNMMHLFGQAIPDRPGVPDDAVRLRQATLVLREAVELIEALGFCIREHGDGKLRLEHANTPKAVEEILLEAGDCSVVAIGSMLSCGASPAAVSAVLELVDVRNALRSANGYVDSAGVFVKTGSPPNMAPCLKRLLEVYA